MSETGEYLAIVKVTSQLEREFESDTDLFHYLHQEGFVKDNHYEIIINPKSSLSNKEKSVMAVADIRHKVALNPQRYYQLLEHLKSNPRKYGDLVDLLDETFKSDMEISVLSSVGINVKQGLQSTIQIFYDYRMQYLLIAIAVSFILWIVYHYCFEILITLGGQIVQVFINSNTPEENIPRYNSFMGTKDSDSSGERNHIDLSVINPVFLSVNLKEYNITILENYGLNGRTGYWWFRFSFDYMLEKSIEVRLANFKYDNCKDFSPEQCKDWTLEVVKCIYLGIHTIEEKTSFDMADDFMNIGELCKLVANAENLESYLGDYIVPLVTRKIKYSKYKPQFRFYLSYLSEHLPFMRTFENGFKFLGYDTWFQESIKPFGNILAKTKTAIDGCDCFLPWIDEKYMKDSNRRSELLYAYKSKKIILPFGDRRVVEEYFTDDFVFMKSLHMYNPTNGSFFEVLRHIDETLFNFETLVL